MKIAFNWNNALRLRNPFAPPDPASIPPDQRSAGSAGFRAALPWLLGSLGISMTGLIGQVPAWSLMAFAACAVWRQRIESWGGRMPSIAVRLAVFLPLVGAVLYKSGMHPSPMALLTFLVALLSLKVLELRSHRDFIVVALLGYFMILSAFFYNQTLALSLYLSLAVMMNTVGLIRCHDGGRKHAVRSSIRLALGLMLQAVPLVVLLFIVFPRVQWDWSRMGSTTTGLTGMSEHLQPGAVASLAQSNEPAFRAKLTSGGQLPARNLYWRGLVLGVCESPMSWRVDERRVVLDPTQPTPGELRIEQQITIIPHGEHSLFALDRPVGIKPSPSLKPELVSGHVLRSRTTVVSKSFYTAFSDLNPKAVGSPPAESYSRAPPGMTPAVLALVKKWTQAAQTLTGAARENEIIRQARLFFRDGGFVYTLSPGELPRERPLDYFLFQSRRGFCEHYAAAFSALMRAAGLPARVVVGYQGGEYNTMWGGYYLVRQSDAHAWSEVWITGHGWQREDPTAVVAPERVSFGAENYAGLTADGPLVGDSRLERLSGLNSPGSWRWLVHNTALAWDGLDQQWNLLVLGYDQERQEDTLHGLGLGNLDWLEGAALALSAAFSLLALGALGVHAYERKQTVKTDPAARLYERFCRRVTRFAGLERSSSEGPLDFSKRAAGALPDQARQIDAITDLYVRSRYAAPAHDDLAQRTLEALTEAVDNFREPAKRGTEPQAVKSLDGSRNLN
jgi:transglutaminase-like putative cysteine protease